jgi:crotonobetainyl-CoA:carnitine CoA-transferase CaiB-like acyl-CoA transferase
MPSPGEDTAAILGELGISEQRAADLAALGVFG